MSESAPEVKRAVSIEEEKMRVGILGSGLMGGKLRTLFARSGPSQAG
jgi:hypothetical protein